MAAVVHAVTLDKDAMSNLVSRAICDGQVRDLFATRGGVSVNPVDGEQTARGT